MIKAVFFDVGSTLIDPEPPVEEVFLEIAQRRGHDLKLRDILPHMNAVYQFYEMEYFKDGDFWCSPEGSVEIWLDMYRFLSHLTGIPQDSEGMAQEVLDAYSKPDCWGPFNDVEPCLKALKKQHLRLGVISNWDPSLRGILRGLQLAPYFEEIISSADVGYRKPNPMIFTLMMERLGLEPHECVHVGDLPDADGIGATSAGLTPVIIDRADVHKDSDFVRIASLEDLPDLIAGL